MQPGQQKNVTALLRKSKPVGVTHASGMGRLDFKLQGQRSDDRVEYFTGPIGFPVPGKSIDDTRNSCCQSHQVALCTSAILSVRSHGC